MSAQIHLPVDRLLFHRLELLPCLPLVLRPPEHRELDPMLNIFNMGPH